MRSSRAPIMPPNCSATESTSGEASIAWASSTVMFGRLIRSRNDLPCERLTKLNFVTNIVVGPICRNMSLNDSSKPRSRAVTLTIEVMPMTTPRMVRAERSLLPAQRLHRHREDFGEEPGAEPGDGHVTATRSAGLRSGSSRAALKAGQMPKKMPTEAEKPMPMANDHHGSEIGKPDRMLISQPIEAPRTMPMTPPSEVRNTASSRNCQRISRRRAPSALRTPISRVRSVTLMVMMAITPMPPTISAIDEITTSARKMPLLIRSQILNSASWVPMSKSLSWSRRRPCRERMISSTSRIAASRGTSSRGMTMIDTSRWTTPKMRSASAP